MTRNSATSSGPRLTPSRVIPNTTTPTPTTTSVAACGRDHLGAGQQLRVGRLDQQEVEGAQPDALHQRLHRGPHHDADQPGEEEVDADQHQQVVRAPAAQVGGGGEDHRERQHLGDQADHRVQQRDGEVGAVLQQVEHAERQVRPQHPHTMQLRGGSGCPRGQPCSPTAEYRRVARRHSRARPPRARTIQPSWAAYPIQMSAAGTPAQEHLDREGQAPGERRPRRDGLHPAPAAPPAARTPRRRRWSGRRTAS